MQASRSRSAAGAWPRWISWLFAPFAGRLEARRQRRRLAQLEAEARTRPHDERILISLADTLRLSGRKEDAINRYWQAAQLYVTSCHYAKALAVIQNALVLEPDAFFLRRGAAQTLERLGRNRDAAEAYRFAAAIAARRGRAPDAEHLTGRADMLDPPKGRPRAPTMVRDLLPEPPAALPPSPLAEALATPAGTAAVSAPPKRAAPIEAELAPEAEPFPIREAPDFAPTPLPEILEEPMLPAPASRAGARANDAPRTQLHIPRAGPPAADSGPDVPILKVRSASEVDAVVAKEMARAFGESALDERRPSAARLDPAIEALAREAALQAHSTELALDAELYLMSNDPAEASTTQCSPREIHEIKTRTLISQAERELQSYLTPEDATVEFDMLDPEGSYA